MARQISLTVNDNKYKLEIDESWTLLEVLRKKLNLTGAKEGCGEGECGACTVIMNGEAVTSCIILGVEADGAVIETIEGQSIDENLSDIQESFIEAEAIQCGFCTPGFVMSTKALLDKNPNPTDTEIGDALEGNLCRCTGYYSILNAVKLAVEKRGGKE